jgi:hypothetical protein
MLAKIVVEPVRQAMMILFLAFGRTALRAALSSKRWTNPLNNFQILKFCFSDRPASPCRAIKLSAYSGKPILNNA